MGLAFFHDVRLHVEWAPDAELASWRSHFRHGSAADAGEASGRPFVSVYDPLGMVRTARWSSEAVALLHGVRLQIYDLSDTQSIAAREFLCRAIIQIQRATQGSPECPSPTGRHPGQAHALDDSDSPRARAFNAYSTPRAEAETRVLKRPRSPCPELGGRSQSSGRCGNEDTAGDEELPGVATGGSRRAARRRAATEER